MVIEGDLECTNRRGPTQGDYVGSLAGAGSRRSGMLHGVSGPDEPVGCNRSAPVRKAVGAGTGTKAIRQADRFAAGDGTRARGRRLKQAPPGLRTLANGAWRANGALLAAAIRLALK